MTQDEIIRMALEAGFDIGGDGLHAYHPYTRDEFPLDTYLERFAALVAAHERELCAKVCDDLSAHYWEKDFPVESINCEECAATIRARGDK